MMNLVYTYWIIPMGATAVLSFLWLLFRGAFRETWSPGELVAVLFSIVVWPVGFLLCTCAILTEAQRIYNEWRGD